METKANKTESITVNVKAEEVDEETLELVRRVKSGEIAVIINPMEATDTDRKSIGAAAGFGIGQTATTVTRAMRGEASYEELTKVGEFAMSVLFGLGQATRASRAHVIQQEDNTDDELRNLRKRIKQLEEGVPE